MALRLFFEMSARIPAYKHFLKKHKINPSKIKNIQDFGLIPPIDKNNYLRQYPLKDLCWDGNLKQGQWVITATSGTTGEPFYFPRSDAQDLQYALLAELYLRTNFQIHKKSTLYINGFALGVWIGGIFTYEAVTTVARRGHYPLSIINPGLNKTGILTAVEKLSPLFDQTIIAGYPPFVKDLIDEGLTQGLNWKKYNLKFIFSAEGFGETWRDYIIDKAGLKNACLDSLNHYGTVDMGTMAYETPFSIMIRRATVKNKSLYHQLFGHNNHLPTLCQYLPEQFYFEVVNGHLICSAYSGLPLVRYDLKDLGGIINLEYLKQVAEHTGFDLNRHIKKEKIANTIWHLPFVYVLRRADFAVKLQLYDIFPETIKEALLFPKIAGSITGKFTLATKYNKEHNQYLEINIEMKPGVKFNRAMDGLIQKQVIKALQKSNSGPGDNINTLLKQKNIIRVVPWSYGHHFFFNYFNNSIKHKWIQK